MSKRQIRWNDLAPLRAVLKGWAFTTVARRRSMVKRARELVTTLPEYVQQEALDEIAAVAAHCNFDDDSEDFI
jgi:hypothetical protein